jgi:hypothetical protein
MANHISRKRHSTGLPMITRMSRMSSAPPLLLTDSHITHATRKKLLEHTVARAMSPRRKVFWRARILS